nr:uncharacterized protein LOC105844956 isoform X1 [Hydra vulgaris]
MNTNTVSNRDVVRSITDNPSAHYEAFLRYLQSTQPTTALVPSSIALSVPSTSGIIGMFTKFYLFHMFMHFLAITIFIFISTLLTFSYIFSCYKCPTTSTTINTTFCW